MEKRGIDIPSSSVRKSAALGIGTLIVFVAMVLVAGIAAYVLLSTSSQLQIKSNLAGEQTTQEAATGLKITSIVGHNTSGLIDKILIDVMPRPGSQDINMNSCVLELSNGSAKYVLQYSGSYWVDRKAGSADLFGEHAFSSVASEFGLIVMSDGGNSCQATDPIINSGDSVSLAINTTACFHGFECNINVVGNVIPENGAWGIIRFRTPSSFTGSVIILQED